MTEVRQCWAYNMDGIRCEHPAGHPGNHVVINEWSDDECATPTNGPVQIPVPVTANMPLETLQTPETKPVKCVACNHQHKGGACKCGCHEFIG